MKRRPLPLNALRAFEAAARLGRMSAAADELAVTPGAISRQIRQLEIRLGLPLFEGSKANPQLSAQAQALLPGLSAAFDQIDATLASVMDDDSVLDVSCFSTFTAKWLLPRLHDFNHRYPATEIRISTGPSGQRSELDRERYDLVITVDRKADQGQDNVIALFPERLGAVLAPSLASRLKLRRPADIPRAVMLHTRTRMDAWQMWGDAIGQTLDSGPGPEFDHYYFTLEAAIGGLGICVAPWHLIIEDIRAGRLVAPFGFVQSGYHYIARHRQRPGKRLAQFCTWLAAQAQATARPDQETR